MAAGFDMVAPIGRRRGHAGKMRESIATLKNVGDSVSTEYRVRHDNGDIVHVMGNVKLIESDGELLLQRYLLDYTDKQKEEVRKDRRQRDLIQALSEDYLLVCSFSLDTKAGEALRVSGDRLRKLDELFAGELNLDSCLGGYINEAVVEEDQAMLRDALSAESLITRLTDESRIHVNYRINHGDVTEYCQATVVRGGDWPQAHNMVLGPAQRRRANSRGDEEEGPAGRGTDPGQQGQRRQERLPLEHVPRHPHAAERRGGLRVAHLGPWRRGPSGCAPTATKFWPLPSSCSTW